MMVTFIFFISLIIISLIALVFFSCLKRFLYLNVCFLLQALDFPSCYEKNDNNNKEKTITKYYL